MKISIRSVNVLCISVDASQVFLYPFLASLALLAEQARLVADLSQDLPEQPQVTVYTPLHTNTSQDAGVLI